MNGTRTTFGQLLTHGRMDAYGAAGQTSVVNCPRAMVGRVIGRQGETIKALQVFTGASIQIDQSREPSAVTISGPPQATNLAQAMIQDIVSGSFKGFAMLRQMAHQPPTAEGGLAGPMPMYIEGYGFVPPAQGLGGGAGAVLMPRTPEAAAQRPPLHVMETTPEGLGQYGAMQNTSALSRAFANMNFGGAPGATGVQGFAGAGYMGSQTPPPIQDLWTAQQLQQPLQQDSTFGSGSAYGSTGGSGSGLGGALGGGGGGGFAGSLTGTPAGAATLSGLQSSSLAGFGSQQATPPSGLSSGTTTRRSNSFSDAWSYPVTSLAAAGVDDGGLAGSGPKFERVSADSVLVTGGAMVPHQFGSLGHSPSFGIDGTPKLGRSSATQLGDVGHIGTPPRGVPFPARHPAAPGTSSLDASPGPSASSPHLPGAMSDSLSRQFPMPPELSLDGVSPASAAAGQLSPAAASTPRCQDSWQRLADPEGRVFWHNNRTGVSQWGPPTVDS